MGCVVNKNTCVKVSESENDFDATFRPKIIFSKYHPRMLKCRWGSNLRTIKEVNLHLEKSLSLGSCKT